MSLSQLVFESPLMSQRSISEIIPPDTQREDYFDNVSLQFCMHYAFESSSKVRLMLENVTRYLRIGGQFIGTIPDSDLLL
jgi:mRNA (guanine-N7-)-methyltransferase